MMGLIKVAKGQPAEALQLVSAAMRSRKPSPQILLNYGMILNALERHQEALESFDQALKQKSKFAEAHNNRGAGRDEEALESFRKALALKPDYAEAHYNNGSSLRILGRYDEALKSFDRALALRPNYVKAHNNRGAVMEALTRLPEARWRSRRTSPKRARIAVACWSASTEPMTRSRISRSRCGLMRAMPRPGTSAADICWKSAATRRPRPISRRRWRCSPVTPRRALPPVSPNFQSFMPLRVKFRAGARPMSKSCAS
jgi:tetratricopeptide (TPR) repeat protein